MSSITAANLPYFDLARTEYHRHLPGGAMPGAAEFVMRASNIEYLAPARFDDLLEVFVRTSHVGRTSVTYEYAVYRVSDDDGPLMATARQSVVLIDHSTRVKLPVPDEFRARVSAFEGVSL